MRSSTGIAPGLALLALLLSASNAQAAKQMPWEATSPPRLIEDRLRVEVGLWNTSINTTLRADATNSQLGTALAGTTLDGEADVGLPASRLMPEIELTLLPGKRQLLRLTGFSSRRSGSAVLRKDVLFDGTLYRVGDVANSTLNLDMVGFGYAYRMLKAPRYELAIGVDVQIAAVEANVYVPRRGIRESDSGVLPIPMLDADARWEVFPKWQLLARYRWLGGSGNSGKVSGHIADWRAGVLWQFSQHLGIGLHYRSFILNVDSSSGSNPGEVNLDHKGVELSFRASL
jgi:hypothetical protein